MDGHEISDVEARLALEKLLDTPSPVGAGGQVYVVFVTHGDDPVVSADNKVTLGVLGPG